MPFLECSQMSIVFYHRTIQASPFAFRYRGKYSAKRMQTKFATFRDFKIKEALIKHGFLTN